MKTTTATILILAASLALGRAADEKPATDKPAATFKSPADKVSYALGILIGNNIKQQSIDANADLLATGIKDMQAGKPLLTLQEAQQTMMAYQTEQRAKLSEKDRAYLAENAKKEGVKTTPSGLQYKILTAGTGPSPKATDTVKAHYRGTLVDGTEFDSSYTRGQPFVSPVNRVIAGWTEALQIMKVGDKWQLTIPGALAYGERGSPPKIGPNATLIFDMELLAIEPPAATTPPGAGGPPKFTLPPPTITPGTKPPTTTPPPAK